MTKNNQTKITAKPDIQEILTTREFDAPRDLVFKAFTDPKLLIQWLGPRILTMTLETFEPRSGGSWRYIYADQHGTEYAFHGSYNEISAPERIIQTFEFEGFLEKGHTILETTRFEVLPGDRTKLSIQSVFQSVSDRDGMLQSGMDRGVNDSHERLEELLEKGLAKHSDRKQAAVQFLQLVVAGRIEKAYQKYVDMGGKHHNPFFPAGFTALQKAMIENHVQFPNKLLTVKHVFDDDDLGAVHSHIMLRPGETGISAVHLFRFHGDKIVEMWDCGQPVPADSPNKDGVF